ncbi:MAG: NAD(P)-dependent dehydrogenase (short-subunit alcohol dehydrogenase family) [Chlamydiales bacterium]|jgi:NAD(P)-dependent dehydrogenase (short-subunit alcohol dehydrogenase family)
MPTVMVTGANRGLGLEFSRQYLGKGWKVLATCREPEAAKTLQDLHSEFGDSLRVYSLDLSKQNDIEELKKEIEGEALDVLINNAGVYYGRSQSFGDINYDDWEKTMQVNLMAPVKMAEVFLENLLKGEKKCLVNITSLMGSITDNQGGGSYLYRSSKAALNAVIKSISIDLKNQGVIATVLHPGWVKTDMGGPNALISPEESIQGMCKVIDQLTLEKSGKFFRYDGNEIPW